MTKTLVDASVEAQRAFIERAIERSRRASTPRVGGALPALTASAGPTTPAVKPAASQPEPVPVATFSAQPVARLADSERLSVAVHEAGHAVVGVVWGGQVTEAEVWSDGRPLIHSARGTRLDGQCRFHLDITAEPHTALIFAAGAVAQAVLLHGPSPTSAEIGALLAGTEDGRELQEMAFAAGGGRFAPGMDVLPLVLRCWPAIAQLGVAMKRGKVIGHRHVTAALGLSSNSALHPFELASIRSGLRTVPDPTRRGQ